MTTNPNGTVRLNVNLNAETAEALRAIADLHDLTFTEAIRRAIAVYDYIDKETFAGRRIQTSDQNGDNARELVLL